MANGDLVAPWEQLARFPHQSNHFRHDGSVKARHYEPEFNHSEGRFETSVWRSEGLTDNEIRQIAQEHIIDKGRKCYGITRCRAAGPIGLRLQVIVDEPPPHHAVIVGWPGEKEERQSLAQELAASATYQPML